MKIHVGDWVRFYRDGRLVIGRVEYPPTKTIAGNWEVATTEGEVFVDSIREVRPSSSSSPEAT